MSHLQMLTKKFVAQLSPSPQTLAAAMQSPTKHAFAHNHGCLSTRLAITVCSKRHSAQFGYTCGISPNQKTSSPRPRVTLNPEALWLMRCPAMSLSFASYLRFRSVSPPRPPRSRCDSHLRVQGRLNCRACLCVSAKDQRCMRIGLYSQ